MTTFTEQYDFTGKTVIPFTTHHERPGHHRTRLRSLLHRCEVRGRTRSQGRGGQSSRSERQSLVAARQFGASSRQVTQTTQTSMPSTQTSVSQDSSAACAAHARRTGQCLARDLPG
ncbi:hypothetical protein [Streptomyces phaeofaciens]